MRTLTRRLADQLKETSTWLSRNRDQGTVTIPENVQSLLDEAYAIEAIASILDEVVAERKRAVEKHGELHLPSVCQILLNRPGGCSPARMCDEYDLPSENRAKYLTEHARENNELTWAHVATEELSEAISAKDDSERRKELVQLAGAILVWIQDIDRNQTPSS